MLPCFKETAVFYYGSPWILNAVCLGHSYRRIHLPIGSFPSWIAIPNPHKMLVFRGESRLLVRRLRKSTPRPVSSLIPDQQLGFPVRRANSRVNNERFERQIPSRAASLLCSSNFLVNKIDSTATGKVVVGSMTAAENNAVQDVKEDKIQECADQKKSAGG